MLWEAYNLKHTTSNTRRSSQEESTCQAGISLAKRDADHVLIYTGLEQRLYWTCMKAEW